MHGLAEVEMSVEQSSDIPCAFDHLVIGARDLDQGAAWSRETLHREAPVGGRHPSMGTINRLARLSQGRPGESGYLEIIAIDPEAPRPARPRWYGLDDPQVQARLAERPRPIAWVMATPDLEASAREAAQAGWDVGEILQASRDDLTWRIAVPRDGMPVLGVLPALIEWPARLHHRPPTARMLDIGLALRELRLYAEDPRTAATLLAALDGAGALARAGVRLDIRQAGPEGPRLEAMLGGLQVDVSA